MAAAEKCGKPIGDGLVGYTPCTLDKDHAGNCVWVNPAWKARMDTERKARRRVKS